jgi:hypothetical protein
MPFSETVKDQAFARSGGRCECHRDHTGENAPHHGGRCPKTFTRHASWEAHHISAGGPDTLSNCEVLCVPCHELTRSYGR